MKYEFDTWAYHRDLGAKLFKAGEEVDRREWMESPDFDDEEPSSLESMSKNELEIYAREAFNVELDKRKKKETLIEEIKALENESR